MDSGPEISVIVAVRDGAATLAETLRCLQGQDLVAWEAVVVDDGSVDESPALIAAAVARDERVRALAVPGLGVSAARNAGVAAARAPWLLFLDADDALESRHLAALRAGALRSPEADVILLDWRIAYADGTLGPIERGSLDPSPAEALAARCPFVIHAAMVRATAVRRAGGFDPGLRICEDWDLWQRVARGGAVFRRAKGAVARYSMSSGSATTRSGEFLDSGVAVIQRGHGSDSRVEDAVPPPPAAGAALAEALLAVWLAGRSVGQGGDGAALLAGRSFRVPPRPDERLLAGVLLEGIGRGLGTARPDWPATWTRLRPAAGAAVAIVEGRARFPKLTAATLIEAERQLAFHQSAGPDAMIGETAVRSFEVGAAPAPGAPAGPVADRVAGIVTRGGREVGRFEAFGVELADPALLRSVLAEFEGSEPAPPAAEGSSAPPGEPEYWEGIFATEDPWDYGNPYEDLKYDQTLAAIPGRAGRALELACAEGLFTRRLAGKAGRLLATDVSPTAVGRARARLADLAHVEVRVLDFERDPLPGGLDLMVCSEVLYYLANESRLAAVAGKFAGALAPGGHLVMAHANLVADNPRSTGFDWPHPFGARRIAEVFAANPGLRHVASWRSLLYRIEVFRKDEAPGAPVIRWIPHAADIPAERARHIRWAGAQAASEGVPVLMYHRVTDDPLPALARWAVAPATFRAQMEWLKAKGFTALSLAEFEATVWEGADLPERPVLITFDDGTRDFGENAAPVLAGLNLPAAVFLPTGHVGGRADWDAGYGPPAEIIGWDEVEALQAQGVAFAAHGHDHLPLTALPYDRLLRETVDPPRIIAERLGKPVAAMAYPYGAHDEAVGRSLYRSGCRLAFTTEHRRWRPGDRAMAIPRLEVGGVLDLAAFARMLGA